MKNILRIFLVFTTAAFISCDEDLDINTNPNVPAEINGGLTLTAAQASIAATVSNELGNVGGFYAQYHTQAPTAGQYENIDQYNLNTTFANTMWTELYAGALNDLQFTKQQADLQGDTGTALMTEVLTAYTYQYLVDLFDDVPYTTALQGTTGNITPALTPGEEVYADLLERIDAALAAYEANPTDPTYGQQDVIYGDDAATQMDNWVKFANTLKLRMYLRMAYTPMANPAAVTALLAENNFLTVDAKFDVFGTDNNRRNPFFETQLSQTGLGDINHVASNSLLQFYVENDDPRYTAVYRPNTAGAYVGIEQGTGDEFNNTAVNYSRPNVQAQTPVFFMSAAESYFLQAEALIRYSGGTGAKEAYDMGVMASFDLYAEHFGLEDTSAAATLLGTGGAYEYQPGADVEATVRQVIIQKWASLAYVNNIEAWIEATRTKFPEIVDPGTEDYAVGNRIPSSISVLPGNTVPSILFYPDDEVTRNPNVTQRGSLTENVWWDQKPE
jgi:hypothetical protein